MRIYQRKKVWYIDYIFQGRRFRKRIGSSKRVAELTLKDIELKIARKEHLGIQETNKILFEKYSEEYLKYAKINKSEKSYTLNITNIKALNLFFKGKYLTDIKPQDIESYKEERSKNLKPASVNRDLACLRHMLNKAIQWGYLLSNPMKGIKLLKEPPGRLRFLSEEEIKRLLQELPAGSKLIILVAMYTGMRRSEILNLNWSNVDLKNRILVVEKTKTNERRIIPINDSLFSQLQELSAKKKSEVVFAECRINLRRNFTDALKRANVRDFRFHDLRHTFASYLVMSGASIKVVQQLLGHKDLKMTMRYSHLSNEHLQEAVGKLNYLKPEKPKPQTIRETRGQCKSVMQWF
ncbi:MAG: tyrosine-type recombinase/integrase [Candidatus Edwardsbacteria bacterium]|nr:tyrosine-type recombinase/integrase [Candidatus Edwardsbacteria bacterium]MBU1577772.1 tyrosine-type recombinase/integrase [Candidatus Edwardsbacteria bacterium]MBU2595037.1 tyrosine-type recombinase/integrase [Candidatus Edwardsbacteria bacterium]